MITAEIRIHRSGSPIRFEMCEDALKAATIGKAAMCKGTDVLLYFWQDGALVLSWESRDGADWVKTRHAAHPRKQMN